MILQALEHEAQKAVIQGMVSEIQRYVQDRTGVKLRQDIEYTHVCRENGEELQQVYPVF